MDFYKATKEELKECGWMQWDQDSGLMLCPVEKFYDLPDGMALTCIGGGVRVKGRDKIDMDSRCGCIAYGLIPGKQAVAMTKEEVMAEDERKKNKFIELLKSVVADNGAYSIEEGKYMNGKEAIDYVEKLR